MIQYLIIGPSGIGKTYWGSKIASQLHKTFVDLDFALRQKHACHDLPGSLISWGTPLFYQRSLSILYELEHSPKAYIIAIGAGTQMAAQGQLELCQFPSLCLWAPPEWLWKKTQQKRQDPRSLEQFRQVEYHPNREQLYQRCQYFIDLSQINTKTLLREILSTI